MLKKYRITIIIIIVFSHISLAQRPRLNEPKRKSKIASVDQFVDNSFSLYYKVFVYDSLTKTGAEIPTEIEDELIRRAEVEADSLWQVLPTIIEDMGSGNYNIMKKGKATINLNKAKKALRFSLEMIKAYFLEEEED